MDSIVCARPKHPAATQTAVQQQITPPVGKHVKTKPRTKPSDTYAEVVSKISGETGVRMIYAHHTHLYPGEWRADNNISRKCKNSTRTSTIIGKATAETKRRTKKRKKKGQKKRTKNSCSVDLSSSCVTYTTPGVCAHTHTRIYYRRVYI